MPKIGNRNSQPITQSTKTEGSSSVESTKQKTVQEEQQQKHQQPNTKPLNEEVKGQRRVDKQYSGLMKQIMVQGQNPGQSWQRGLKPGEKPQTQRGTQQTNQQGQGWVKATPNKGQPSTGTPDTNQQQQSQGLTGAPKQQPPTPQPLEQRPNRLFQKPLVGTQKEQMQPEPLKSGAQQITGGRNRAMGHSESTLPEMALNNRAQVDKSGVDSRMTSLTSNKQKTVDRWDNYKNELEKPLPKDSEGRQQQFQNSLNSLNKMKIDPKETAFRKVGPEKMDRYQNLQNEKQLLTDTMNDKALVNSPYTASVNHAMELKRYGLQPTVAGRVGQFQDTRLEGDMKQLGKGAMNTVYSGTYKLPDNQGSFQGVYKPEPKTNRSDIGHSTGIDDNNPRFGYRNVATTRLDQELGFGITARTEMAMHKNQLGTVQEKAKGTTLYGDRVPGGDPLPDFKTQSMKNTLTANGIQFNENNWTEKYNKLGEELGVPSSGRIGMKDGKVYHLNTQTHDFNYNDPNLRKDLVRLQMTDFVSGQVDRHGGNYMVNRDRNGNYLGLKGIDNDLSWGKNFNSMKDVTNTSDSGRVSATQGYNNLSHLPPVVDRETFDAFKRLTPQTFSNKMGGLLTQDEINAGGNRLKEMHTHLDGLEKNGRVINSNEWGSQKVTDWLMERKQGEHTNFVSRDLEFQEDRRRLGLVIPYTPKD